MKHCDHCGEVFHRPVAVSASQWEKRRYCSVRCSALERTGKYATKHCDHCGKRMEKPLAYSTSAWKATRFCSRSCAGRWLWAARQSPDFVPKNPGAKRRRSTLDYRDLREVVGPYSGPTVAALLGVPADTVRKWHDDKALVLPDEVRPTVELLAKQIRRLAAKRPGVPEDGRDVTDEGVPMYEDDLPGAEAFAWAEAGASA